MTRNEHDGNRMAAIPFVGRVSGVVSRGRQETERVSCRTVARIWVEGFMREDPGENDPRVIAYGAYLLALRTGYGIRRQPRTPWREVSCAKTLHMWLDMWRRVVMATRGRRIDRLVRRNIARDVRIELARARALAPREMMTTPQPFYCGPVWGTVELRWVYIREENGVGPVSGVGRYRSTRHIGFEVADPSGRHGWPAIARFHLYNGVWYEFGMGQEPEWTFVFEVGQNTAMEHIHGAQYRGDINVLTMPQPPAEPDVEELDAWGRGPDSGSDTCDTESDSDTEDDEVLSRRGRYPAGYPFLQNTLRRHRQ